MAKISLKPDSMAEFMVCEAIAQDRHEFEDVMCPDENGRFDISIQINGRELNANRFLEALHRSYTECVEKRASELLSCRYQALLGPLYEIEELLQNHSEVVYEMEGCVPSNGEYDIALIEKPIPEGLTADDILWLIPKVDTGGTICKNESDGLCPVEFLSGNSSAMGFISGRASEMLGFGCEKSRLSAFITGIMDDMEQETEDHLYHFSGLRILLTRRERS